MPELCVFPYQHGEQVGLIGVSMVQGSLRHEGNVGLIPAKERSLLMK